MFNKGPVNVKNAASIKTGSIELYTAYSSDSVLARQKYADKILEVTGIIIRVSKNQQNQDVVMLQTNESGAYVNCTIEEEGLNFVENKQATLKGICTGMGMSDQDLGIMGDVYLIRCYNIN